MTYSGISKISKHSANYLSTVCHLARYPDNKTTDLEIWARIVRWTNMDVDTQPIRLTTQSWCLSQAMLTKFQTAYYKNVIGEMLDGFLDTLVHVRRWYAKGCWYIRICCWIFVAIFQIPNWGREGIYLWLIDDGPAEQNRCSRTPIYIEKLYSFCQMMKITFSIFNECG